MTLDTAFKLINFASLIFDFHSMCKIVSIDIMRMLIVSVIGWFTWLYVCGGVRESVGLGVYIGR